MHPLIAVVGPSGAGKDTLIGLARRARPGLHVVRRVITRPHAPGDEDFDSVSEAEFSRRAATGGFVLSWQAHGFLYGIPSGVIEALRAAPALFNGSRAVIPEARALFPTLRVIVVTAPPETLAARLTGRSRESGAEVASRLARASYAAPEGAEVSTVVNDTSLEQALDAFLAALDAAVVRNP